MQGKNKERWQQLCEQASVEHDSEKLLGLVDEIIELLEDKQARLSREHADEKEQALAHH